MTDLHNGGQLDWDTYRALSQVVKEAREELIKEREDESCPEWRKSSLLDRQMQCTDIQARLLERMQDDMDPRLNKKES